MDGFSEQHGDEHVKDRKKRKRILFATIIGAAVLVGIAVIVIFSYYYVNRSYSGYDVVSETTRSDSNSVIYLSFQDNLLKYSRDGISVLDEEGATLWNGGYEMEKPSVDICGDYVMVADIGAKKCYVYNGEDQGTDITTALPIGRAKVSANGKVAVLLHDQDSDIINIYNPYSTVEPLEVEIPTNVVDDGYPLDFDLSPDGESLVVSYLLTKNGVMENKICFYNFTEVGQDQNTLVGGKSLDQKMVAEIAFVAEDEVVIFYEDGFSLFENMKKPEVVFEKTFEEEIKSTGFDDENIMVITGTAGSTDDQVLTLFSHQGKEELSQAISYQYSSAVLQDREIVFTSDQTCNIMRKNGNEKFSFDFGKAYEYFFPAPRDNQYYFIEEATIQTIKISG